MPPVGDPALEDHLVRLSQYCAHHGVIGSRLPALERVCVVGDNLLGASNCHRVVDIDPGAVVEEGPDPCSLCQEAVRSYAVETGLDPGSRVIDASGADAMFLGTNSTSVAGRLFAAVAATSRQAKLFGPSALYSDALGKLDSPTGTLEGTMRHNVKTIVEALK